MQSSQTRDRNACAYKEIYEILKIFPHELVSKIPQEKITFFQNNMDANYEYNISKETFDGRTMLRETQAILTILFRDYWATPAQKEKILNYEKTYRSSLQENSKVKYSSDNLFKKQETLTEQSNEKAVETALVEHKESFVKKIINKFLNFFRKVS